MFGEPRLLGNDGQGSIRPSAGVPPHTWRCQGARPAMKHPVRLGPLRAIAVGCEQPGGLVAAAGVAEEEEPAGPRVGRASARHTKSVPLWQRTSTTTCGCHVADAGGLQWLRWEVAGHTRAFLHCGRVWRGGGQQRVSLGPPPWAQPQGQGGEGGRAAHRPRPAGRSLPEDVTTYGGGATCETGKR